MQVCTRARPGSSDVAPKAVEAPSGPAIPVPGTTSGRNDQIGRDADVCRSARSRPEGSGRCAEVHDHDL